MWITRLIGAFRELRRDRARAAEAEETASYELTTSARRFARQTRSVSKDKLSFSAALMRAGESAAANRMIEEFERDVRTEEAALLERMNEVKLARAAKRERVTRLRLASVLVVAVMGAGLLSFAAAGLAVGSFMADRHSSSPQKAKSGVGRVLQSRAGSPSTRVSQPARKMVVRVLAGKTVEMTPAQFRRYRELMTEKPGQAELESFLSELLPHDEAKLISRVLAASIAQAGQAADAAQKVAGDVVRKVPKKVRSKVPDAPKEPPPPSADQAKKDEGQSPSPEPSPSPSSSPSQGDGSPDLNGDRGGDGIGDVAPESLFGD